MRHGLALAALAAAAVLAAFVAYVAGVANGRRSGSAHVRQTSGAANDFINDLCDRLWRAENEAYRWKLRALRLGWRRDEKRWDR